ncbi:MAG: hypothetical protein RR715_02450 [Comamonas sp.]
MGTITARKRADGTTAYTAQIRLKEQGVIVHTEAQTFTKKALPQAWLTRREAAMQEARATGVFGQAKFTVRDLLDAYVKQSKGITEWGQRTLRASGLSDKDARMLTAADLIEYAQTRRIEDGAGPATVLNDIIWLRQAFLSGAAMFDVKQPVVAADAAKAELLRTKLIAKPVQRKRRLSPEEEGVLAEYFGSRDARSQIPMLEVFQFALLTARRQEEIC